MNRRFAWIVDLVWQAVVVGAVPGVVGLAIIMSGSERKRTSAGPDDHACSGVNCHYCRATRNPGLAGAPPGPFAVRPGAVSRTSAAPAARPGDRASLLLRTSASN